MARWRQFIQERVLCARYVGLIIVYTACYPAINHPTSEVKSSPLLTTSGAEAGNIRPSLNSPAKLSTSAPGRLPSRWFKAKVYNSLVRANLFCDPGNFHLHNRIRIAQTDRTPRSCHQSGVPKTANLHQTASTTSKTPSSNSQTK